MSERLKQTVRILKRSKVQTDDRGRSVWVDPVDTAELELVSTVMLKRMLDSGDEQRKDRIRKAAQGKDGVLARDAENDTFEIIDDDDLQQALQAASDTTDVKTTDVSVEPLMDRADSDDEELSLVSTQALRRILTKDAPQTEDSLPVEEEQGFDPYNSG